MPTYKYSNTAGKTMWYCSFYYIDWTGARKRKVKRGFTTRRDASRYEDAYKVIQCKEPTIQLGAVVEDYLKDCELKLKPTTMRVYAHLYPDRDIELAQKLDDMIRK